MRFNYLLLQIIPTSVLMIIFIFSSVNNLAAQPVVTVDEQYEGLLSYDKHTIIPKKVLIFNDVSSNNFNGTKIEKSIEETYESRPIPVVDKNYSLPVKDIIIPNGTVLDKSDNFIKHVKSFIDCKTCYKTYSLLNKNQLNVNTSHPINILDRSRSSNSNENITIPIMFTNKGFIETLSNISTGFSNMTSIPEVLSQSQFNISAKPIKFTSVNNTFKSLVAEPTIAKKNNTLIFINNYFFARSINDGKTWSLLNMLNDPDIDICCDNRVIYDKNHKIFVWYAQGTENETQGYNTNRIGVSKDGYSWIMYYFKSQDIWPSRTSFVFDFPHLVAGDKYLYLFTSLVQKRTENIHQIVIRIPLEELSRCDPKTNETLKLETCKVSFDFYLSHNKLNYSPIYNVKDSVYWATFLTNNLMRVYHWNENSTSFTDVRPVNIEIPPFSMLHKNNTSCDPQKDKFQTNWCLRTDSRILTGWKNGNLLGFLWDADSKGENVYRKKFQFPYIEATTLEIKNGNLERIGRPYVYNNGTPFLYPAVSVNSNGQIGLLAYYGDEVLKPSIIFGMSSNMTQNLPWNIQVVKKSTDIPRTGNDDKDILAWGDFITLQSEGDSWYGTAFVVEGGNTSDYVQPYYIKIKK